MGAEVLDAGLELIAPCRVYDRYEHHGAQVWVDRNLKGLHRHYCLCYQCRKFSPGKDNNCPIAQDTYENCVKHGLVTPVWECPEFEEE